jgi:hypothetical protein
MVSEHGAPVAEPPTDQLATCPACGHRFDPVRIPRKARMVWSNRVERFVRKHLTDAEWTRYDEKGSID